MKKFVQVGCGIRGIEGYAEPILKDFREHIEFCGVYDINPKRAALVSFYGGVDVPVFDDRHRVLHVAALQIVHSDLAVGTELRRDRLAETLKKSQIHVSFPPCFLKIQYNRFPARAQEEICICF